MAIERQIPSTRRGWTGALVVVLLLALAACSSTPARTARATRPTTLATSARPDPSAGFPDLTKQRQHRLFAQALGATAVQLRRALDPTGEHLRSEHAGRLVASGSKGLSGPGRYDPRRYRRAPWASIDLLAARYLWHTGRRTTGELVLTIGDRATLPCGMENGQAVDWSWKCHPVRVTGAPRALAGTCHRHCASNIEIYASLAGLGRWEDAPYDGRYDGVAVDRSDGLVVTLLFARRGSATGPSVVALPAAAADARITRTWIPMRTTTWMPPPSIDYARFQAAGLRALGRHQFFLADYAIGSDGSGAGTVECIKRLARRCETRTVNGKRVLVTYGRDGAVDMEYRGPRYSVVLSGRARDLPVAKAVRLVSSDRWQPAWSW